MIETTLINYLESRLTDLEGFGSVPVYMEFPAEQTDYFVVIDRTGGSYENRVTSAMFAFQSVAPSLLQAATLNRHVLEAVKDAVGLPEIGGVHIESPGYNFTDSRTKQYRYQMVAEVFYIEE